MGIVVYFAPTAAYSAHLSRPVDLVVADVPIEVVANTGLQLSQTQPDRSGRVHHTWFGAVDGARRFPASCLRRSLAA